MKPQRATALFIALALCVIRAPGNPVRAQTGSAEYSRQSDVTYGRKFGLALTMEVFTPAKPNGLGVVWVVSSSGKSSREQTLQPSFERRISTKGAEVQAEDFAGSPSAFFQTRLLLFKNLHTRNGLALRVRALI